MANIAPPIVPPDSVKPTRHQERLRRIICLEIGLIESSKDRQMFSELLDLLTPREGDEWTLPKCRANGRADYPGKRAILYTTILHAIHLMWGGANTKDLEIAVLQAEAFADLSTLTGYSVVGTVAEGFTLEIKKHECA